MHSTKKEKTKMKKMAVICANGRAGKEIVKEAVRRGLDVTAVARHANQSAAEKFIQKDLFALTREDLAGFDVVIDAFGAWTEKTLPLHVTSVTHLCDLLSGTKTRLLVVGGAGSLYTNKEHTRRVMDAPDFPAAFMPAAIYTAKALDALHRRNDVAWTCISPACDFCADGKKTGSYFLAGEELTLNEKGESIISYADYAAAMIDEAVERRHVKERISVAAR